ncbi:3b4b70bb-6926-4e5f-8011-0c84d4c8c40c [Sclerotinia trifoliorum]|uniref:3b4b70bb-6926-4e5f-8011-0c84d4c8c40c n=1 Tax=Sclerotinia trifoliorum TaxID=28548 RepID=A0A8H2W1D9_9HELO|nr:3b4b70bb-6926-4e5f-8011-0c84d4c8c40c [Sclerotinia trifoliorum]
MEFILRCNALKCRKELSDHAVVTTCSHVFCIECSNQSQLSTNTQDNRRSTCPACDMLLPNPDDVVVANLNPSEDYKTSVLSGLTPGVIVECAGRALSFWAYQTTQEIVYQEYLAKSLTDKYSTLNTQMDKIIHDANSEISSLRNKIISMSTDQDALRRKNEELNHHLREKNKKLLQTQELYDKMKRKGLLDQVQTAASNAVDDTIEATVTGNRFADNTGTDNQRPHQQPFYTNQQAGGMHQSGGFHNPTMPPPPLQRRRHSSGWDAIAGQGLGQGSQRLNQVQATPSSHRQPLISGNFPPVSIGMNNLQHHMAGTPLSLSQGRVTVTPRRTPLSGLNVNVGQVSGFAGYGMRAGLKVGNQGASVASEFSRPSVRSVAQRPGSNLAFSRDSGLGTPSISRGENNYY